MQAASVWFGRRWLQLGRRWDGVSGRSCAVGNPESALGISKLGSDLGIGRPITTGWGLSSILPQEEGLSRRVMVYVCSLETRGRVDSLYGVGAGLNDS